MVSPILPHAFRPRTSRGADTFLKGTARLTQCFIPNKISGRQNAANPAKEVALPGQNH